LPPRTLIERDGTTFFVGDLEAIDELLGGDFQELGRRARSARDRTGGVGECDASVTILDGDAVVQGLEDDLQAPADFGHTRFGGLRGGAGSLLANDLFFGATQSLFGGATLAQIPRDLAEAAQRTSLVAERGDDGVRPEARAILAYAPAFVFDAAALE